MEVTKISPHPITGQSRGIRIKQITYVDFDIEEAKVTWEEVLLDENDEPIFHETVPMRQIVSHISNSNKVTEQGILIDRAFIESTNPQEENETDEEYSKRIDEILTLALENGIPEFDFYVGAILNMDAIEQGILLLDNFKRFDRK